MWWEYGPGGGGAGGDGGRSGGGVVAVDFVQEARIGQHLTAEGVVEEEGHAAAEAAQAEAGAEAHAGGGVAVAAAVGVARVREDERVLDRVAGATGRAARQKVAQQLRVPVAVLAVAGRVLAVLALLGLRLLLLLRRATIFRSFVRLSFRRDFGSIDFHAFITH